MTFKHQKAGWKNKCKVTERNMEWNFKSLLNDWLAKPAQFRRNVLKKDFEESAETSAFVETLVLETLARAPNMQAAVEEKFIQVYIHGSDPQLLLELQCIMHDRPEQVAIGVRRPWPRASASENWPASHSPQHRMMPLPHCLCRASWTELA